jgi:hypothetical protein
MFLQKINLPFFFKTLLLLNTFGIKTDLEIISDGIIHRVKFIQFSLKNLLSANFFINSIISRKNYYVNFGDTECVRM